MPWSSPTGWNNRGWSRAAAAAGGLGTPFLLGGGTEVGIAPGTSPRSTTIATAPVGSVIMAAVLNVGENGAVLSGFSDGTNSYSVGAGSVLPYAGGTGDQRFALYASSILTTALSSGASVGPNLSASTKIYQVLVCFPGVTTLDPEAPSITGQIALSPVTATVPSNSTQPQYAAFSVLGTSGSDTSTMTAPYTDVAFDIAENATFGIRFWVALITNTGAPTTLTATIAGGGGGVVSASAQRTVS